jgi:hypothetical protein
VGGFMTLMTRLARESAAVCEQRLLSAALYSPPFPASSWCRTARMRTMSSVGSHLRDVHVTAAREDELASPLFSRPAEERMISQELKSPSHAQNLFTRLLRILRGDEVKEPFEVS